MSACLPHLPSHCITPSHLPTCALPLHHTSTPAQRRHWQGRRLRVLPDKCDPSFTAPCCFSCLLWGNLSESVSDSVSDSVSEDPVSLSVSLSVSDSVEEEEESTFCSAARLLLGSVVGEGGGGGGGDDNRTRMKHAERKVDEQTSTHTKHFPSKHARSNPEMFWLWPAMAITANMQPESARIVYIYMIRLPASVSVLFFQRKHGSYCAKLTRIRFGWSGQGFGQTHLVRKQAGVRE